MPASNPIVPVGKDPRTKRIADYVNDHFDGNCTQAADAIGCNYDQLLSAARGVRARGPSIELLVKLSQHSGRSVDWWATGKETTPI